MHHLDVFEPAEISEIFRDIAVTSLAVEPGRPISPEIADIPVDSDVDFCPAASVCLKPNRCLDDLTREIAERVHVNQNRLSDLIADAHLDLRDNAFFPFHDGPDLVRSGRLFSISREL